jgi:hypothetical protein
MADWLHSDASEKYPRFISGLFCFTKSLLVHPESKIMHKENPEHLIIDHLHPIDTIALN